MGSATRASESDERSQSLTVTRSGEQPSSKGSDQYFTGSVRVDPLFQPKEPSRVSGAYVTFEPGARSAWHTHPLGQTLVVTAGTGWVQEWNGEKREIRPGDVVWTPPGVKHWHGATVASRMTHIAIQESLDGKNVEWMEKVSDEQYGKTAATPGSNAVPAVPRLGDVRLVSPALERYTQGMLLGDLWKRPALSPRDRSIVTSAALIARGQTVDMPFYFNLALDRGVKPAELSEVITHLAFYSGWATATSAAAIAKDVFAERNIGTDQLPPASGPRLPLDEAAEAQRASRVAEDFGQVAPGVVQYTTDVLFRDLWLRPALAPRDRSLVTVSALVATGQSAQITFHLNRAMDNGLTKTEASEALTQLAFYAGGPNVFSALPVVKSVLEKRPGAPPAADRGSSMKLKLSVDGKVVTATLIDSGTTRDFVSLLPLTLTTNDLFKREKFGHLPRALSEDGERARTYQVGDVAYWPPGPDVAVFYRHDGQKIPAPGITVLGRIDSGVEAFSAPRPLRVTLERLE
jgi:4-carboxymuconolactone decarboxylase